MNAQSREELEDKILSKRQQIEFERTNLEETVAFDPENRENPDIMEEAKNFDDPATSVAEKDELRSLETAERELQSLLKQLEELNQG